MALRDQLRVLVVDDMSTSRGLIAQALDGFGILSVNSAVNGATALQSLAEWPVHLIISDYNMPEMDGLRLLQNLRANPRTHKTGFILITGSIEQQIIDRGRKLGMNNFLRKPFRPENLRECVEAVVGRL